MCLPYQQSTTSHNKHNQTTDKQQTNNKQTISLIMLAEYPILYSFAGRKKISCHPNTIQERNKTNEINNKHQQTTTNSNTQQSTTNNTKQQTNNKQTTNKQQ